DGLFFVYIDRDLEQTTHVFLKSTPLSFLVQEKIVFKGDVTVTKIERSPGILQIKIKKTKEPELGSIQLVFSDKPLLLRKWVVVDTQNIITTVNLTGIQTGIKLDPKLFTLPTKKND
ncbi:MAG TPA: outer membrane lipoprotein carrier protein LolA, partial [Rhodospirillales bacterium]|nr:outer membrane lipoprotein carrier protein LolA [Rhodospirillales bacterium]